MTPPLKKRVRWYRRTIRECVLCGSTDTLREAMRSKPPQRRSKRTVFLAAACSKHFV